MTLRTEHGLKTFVDPCPIELGRDVSLMREISERSGVNIICTTGFYHEDLGLPTYWRARNVEEITELFVREITHGIGDTGVKAGAIKVSTGSPVISAQEKKFVAAACIAHKATGVPIITHTTNGFAGPEQQQLFANGGVPANACLIGHCCCNPDPVYHRRIVDGGSYIGFDQIGMFYYQTDEVRADNLVRLLRHGFRAQIMMSMDRVCSNLGKFSFQVTDEYIEKMEYLKSRGLYQSYTYLFTDFIPLLYARGVSDTDINFILESNPRRFFAGEQLPVKPTN